MSKPHAFGATLRRLREQRGLSRQQLADATGLGTSTLYQLEDERKSPTLVTIRKLAKKLGVQITELVGE